LSDDLSFGPSVADRAANLVACPAAASKKAAAEAVAAAISVDSHQMQCCSVIHNPDAGQNLQSVTLPVASAAYWLLLLRMQRLLSVIYDLLACLLRAF
jgi:hypothetical protein